MAHAWKACWVHALAGSNPASSATPTAGPASAGASAPVLIDRAWPCASDPYRPCLEVHIHGTVRRTASVGRLHPQPLDTPRAPARARCCGPAWLVAVQPLRSFPNLV